MTHASSNRVQLWVAWEWWPDGLGWKTMSCPVSRDAAVSLSGYSDAQRCRILPEGEVPDE